MILIIFSALYLASRLIKLNALPVFADEAIYIRWAQFIFCDHKKAFISLTDGKPPLFIWLTTISLRLIKDPLLAGRMVSVILGFFALIFLYKSVNNFFNQRAALWTALFYLTCPFFFIYNRMALIEGLLAFTLCLQFYFLSLFWRTKNKNYILLSGISWGFSMLSKTSAFFFFCLYLPLGFYLQDKKNLFKNKKTLFYLSLAGILGVLIFFITKTSIFFPSLIKRSRDFSFTFEEFFQGQYKSALERLMVVMKWLIYYNSPLVFVLFLGSLWFLIKSKKTRENKVIFLFWFFVVIFLLPMAFFGKILAPRYFLPLSLIISSLAGLVINQLRWPWLKILLMTGILGFNSYFIGLSLIDVDQTPFLQIDKTYYLQEWSSGHGIKEAYFYLKNIAEKEKILVATEGFFGTLPDGFSIYKDAYGGAEMDVIGLGETVKSVPEDITKQAKNQRTFLIGNSHRFVFSEEQPLRLIKSYDRPAGGPKLMLYEVLDEN
jgi:4-amino-4-deoxy-L-arabinose transferase-like glycosyltransferase